MAGAGLDTEARARAWHHGLQAAICDVVEPWAHGTVLRATQLPDYWDFNVVRVEGDPPIEPGELVAFADEALGACAHRRIDFDDAEAGGRYREAFSALGWRALRLLYMRHEADPGPAPASGLEVEEVAYDDVLDLRIAWHAEDFPDQGPTGYHEQARSVALAHGARVFTAVSGGERVGFAQLEYAGDGAEITQVYVHPDHRGSGLGTAITRASIDAAGPVADLWISADDEDRPKELYRRLGFRPAWLSVELTLMP
ncbi:MAG: GNAT family N-acetyltransferase [Solirubrobacterales bacterium]